MLANEKLNNIKIYLYEPPKQVTNNSEINKIMHDHHTAPAGGHVGKTRLLKKLKNLYYWEGMNKSVHTFIKNCHKCQMNKHVNVKPNVQDMQITTTPDKAFDLVSIDTVGPFTKTLNNNRYAVTIQCDLTKYIVIIPVENKEARTVAKAMVENFILIYGPMARLKSDMGTEYRNEIFTEIAKILKIEQLFATAYHPQSIGALERNHKCLNEYLGSYVNEQIDDWDEWTSYYSFCYNTTPNVAHEFSPFELVFGRKTSIPKELNNSVVDAVYNVELYNKELKYRLQLAHERAKNYLLKAKFKRKAIFDEESRPFNMSVNDRVLLKNEQKKKLEPLYAGPFVVISVDEPNCVIRDERSGKTQTVHSNRIKRFYEAN